MVGGLKYVNKKEKASRAASIAEAAQQERISNLRHENVADILRGSAVGEELTKMAFFGEIV